MGLLGSLSGGGALRVKVIGVGERCGRRREGAKPNNERHTRHLLAPQVWSEGEPGGWGWLVCVKRGVAGRGRGGKVQWVKEGRRKTR